MGVLLITLILWEIFKYFLRTHGGLLLIKNTSAIVSDTVRDIISPGDNDDHDSSDSEDTDKTLSQAKTKHVTKLKLQGGSSRTYGAAVDGPETSVAFVGGQELYMLRTGKTNIVHAGTCSHIKHIRLSGDDTLKLKICKTCKGKDSLVSTRR